MDINNGESYYIRELLKKLKLKDVMTKDVHKVNVNSPFSSVEEKMRRHKIRHVPVVDDGNKLVGIVTQRDLFRIVSPKISLEGDEFFGKELLDDFILSRVMTKNPFYLRESESLADAVLKMSDTKYGSVLVVDENHSLTGIITQFDIIKFCAAILRM